jgi:uncharacterized OB-fold protein
MRPYWEAAAGAQLVVAHCEECGAVENYARPFCSRCLSENVAWRPVAGTGLVYTYTVVRRAPHPFFGDRIPYVLAIVELDGGARLLTNIVGCDPADVRIGARVAVRFEPSNAGDVPVFVLDD